MATSPRKRLSNLGDGTYKKAHDRALLLFAKGFDEWAARVESTRESWEPISGSAILGDLIKGASDDRRQQLGEGVDLVWELAKLCRRFVSRELVAWALDLRRRGVSDQGLVCDRLTERAVDVERETRHRKWRAGLGVISLDRLNPYYEDTSDVRGERAHEAHAWRFVVEESIAEFIVAIVENLDRLDEWEGGPKAARATERRERIDKKLATVVKVTGEMVNHTHFFLAANYANRKQLQSYLRGEDSQAAIKNFERAFKMEPNEFLAAAERKRRLIVSRET